MAICFFVKKYPASNLQIAYFLTYRNIPGYCCQWNEFFVTIAAKWSNFFLWKKGKALCKNPFALHCQQKWADCEIFQSESSPDLQIFENHQSDPVLIRQCKIMYFYFASWGKRTTWAILPFTNYDWLKAKYFQQCLCLLRQNRHSLSALPKFNKKMSIRH